MRPFLKWAGNKYQIIRHLQDLLPPGKRLVEPFAGSGAVFLNTDYTRNLLNDINPDLINLYQILKTNSQLFIEDCRHLFEKKKNNKEHFYSMRHTFNHSTDPWVRAQLFIYLNRHAFNGLCRYNKQGEFNVPFGCIAKPYFPEQEMQHFAKKAKKAQFVRKDFLQILQKTKPGDIVYCDPPYVPLTDTAYFTAYNPGNVFGMEQQIILAQQAEQLANRGIPVIISNHDTAFTRNLYAKAQLMSLQVKRSISCKVHLRKKVGELIAVYL